MKRLHPNDRDVRDAKLIKTRVTNIHKLILNLREKHYLILENKDEVDLNEAQRALETLLERYKFTQI